MEDTRPYASVDEEQNHQQNDQRRNEHRSDFIAVAPAIDSVEHFTVDGAHSLRIEGIAGVLVVVGIITILMTILLSTHRHPEQYENGHVTSQHLRFVVFFLFFKAQKLQLKPVNRIKFGLDMKLQENVRCIIQNVVILQTNIETIGKYV